MKIKWGALVVDGRGKLGGHVAAQNKGGSYLRTKVTPSNPQTTAQSTVRAIFGQISASWAGLTSDAIKAWNSATDEWKKSNVFGDLKELSGKALFQRLNNQAVVAGFPEIPLPPAKLEMVDGVVTAGSIGITAAEIEFTGVYNGTNARQMVFSSGPVSRGTTFVKNLMRHVGTNTGATFDASGAYTDYVAKFGAPVAGEIVYIGVKYVLPNGQASPLQIIRTEVSA